MLCKYTQSTDLWGTHGDESLILCTVAIQKRLQAIRIRVRTPRRPRENGGLTCVESRLLVQVSIRILPDRLHAKYTLKSHCCKIGASGKP